MSPVSDGEQLWPPPEDDGGYTVSGPWDTLSVDIVGPLPADNRQEYLIVFVDCYSRYTILGPASNHTANTVSEVLLRHVAPYFGTPRRLLSDCCREFVDNVWGKLMYALGVQRILTSPYHPEGNAINERSHRTMNNMLRARLLESGSSKTWVEKVPSLMLALNAMPHELHGFSASMIAAGHEPILPPDLQHDACASPSVGEPTTYAEVLKGVDREKSAVFKELTQNFRTYELRGQAKKKKKVLTESKTNKYLTLSYKNYLQKA